MGTRGCVGKSTQFCAWQDALRLILLLPKRDVGLYCVAPTVMEAWAST